MHLKVILLEIKIYTLLHTLCINMQKDVYTQIDFIKWGSVRIFLSNLFLNILLVFYIGF